MNTNMAKDQSERKGQAALSVVLAAQYEGPIGAKCLFLSSSEHSAYTHTLLLKWVQFVYCHPLALSYAPIWIWRGVFVLPMQRSFTFAGENYYNISCHKCFPLMQHCCQMVSFSDSQTPRASLLSAALRRSHGHICAATHAKSAV